MGLKYETRNNCFSMEPGRAVIMPIMSVMLWSTQGPVLHEVIEHMKSPGIQGHQVPKVIE